MVGKEGELTELESGHVFRMRSVQDLFRKLHRELRRFQKAGSDREGRLEQADSIINFAITAWHMTDWIWQGHLETVSERFGVNSLRQFQDKICEHCPYLSICDVIANAAKHGGKAHKRELRPEVETILVAHPVQANETSVELYAALAQREWSLKIKASGKEADPHAVLRTVFRFWGRFVQEHCIVK